MALPPPRREKQAALAAEEAKRKAAAAASAAHFRAGVAAQVGEKEAARLAVAQAKRAELVQMMAELQAGWLAAQSSLTSAAWLAGGGVMEVALCGGIGGGAPQRAGTRRGLPPTTCTPRCCCPCCMACPCLHRHTPPSHPHVSAPLRPPPPLQLCKETEAAAKAAELARMAAFKAELDAQIAADQARAGHRHKMGAMVGGAQCEASSSGRSPPVYTARPLAPSPLPPNRPAARWPP